MTEQVVARIPVFLPGNDRNWDQSEGQMVIDDEGTMTIHLGEESAQKLADYAKEGILFQVSFDYRASTPKNDWPNIIMVGSMKEMEWARSAGWALLDIVMPKETQLEGRRYKNIHITWEALAVLGNTNTDILSMLEADQARMNTTLTIGNVKPPKE